jgi:uncharacterized protein (TIRG00374 family)
MKMLRVFLVVAGLATIAALVAATGLDDLLASVRMLSWRLGVVVVVPYAAVALLHTIAWGLVFLRTRVSVRRLFLARLAGEALNMATASVGGEPVKAYVLRAEVDPVEASAAILVEKTAITISQVLFLALGFVVALAAYDLPSGFRTAMAGLLALQILAVGAFVLVQLAGVFRRVSSLLARFGVRAGGAGLVEMDRDLAASYLTYPGRVLACTVVHVIGWIVGSLEVWLIARWLNVQMPLTTAFVIDAFGTGLSFLAFAIPGALGALEGGYMLVFSVMGFTSGLGLSVTLVRRLRMLLWTVLGVAVLARPGGSGARSGDVTYGVGARR